MTRSAVLLLGAGALWSGSAILSLPRAGTTVERDVGWSRGDVQLRGTLSTPATPGRHPLAVLVPGSGCMPLTHAFVRAHVRELTSRGLAVFRYDKRGCGQSTGDWHVPLDTLAADVSAVLPLLAADSVVDRSRIGLWGLSQGGWVALIAAGHSTVASYVVLQSGPPMTPAEQGHAVIELGMLAKGHSAADIARAVALDRMIWQVYRTDRGWEEAARALAAVANEPWFKDANLGLEERSSRNWQWLRTIMDYDPLPALRSLPIPILAVFGARDTIVPAERSARIIDSLATSARGPRASQLVRDAGHQLRPGNNRDWPVEYWDGLTAWMRQQNILR